MHRAIAKREHERHALLQRFRSDLVSPRIHHAMSIQNYKDFEKGNLSYVEDFGEKGRLPIPPGKKLAVGSSSLHIAMRVRFIKTNVVTCMDARLQ